MRTLLLAFAAALSIQGATTTTWELNSWQDLVRGRFDGVALDRDGRLMLAPLAGLRIPNPFVRRRDATALGIVERRILGPGAGKPLLE